MSLDIDPSAIDPSTRALLARQALVLELLRAARALERQHRGTLGVGSRGAQRRARAAVRAASLAIERYESEALDLGAELARLRCRLVLEDLPAGEATGALNEAVRAWLR